MEEPLISFETAKLAKEKGFNLWYKYSGYVYDLEDEQLSYIYQHKNSVLDVAIYAPTQSLLQKWIWENHNLWISSTPIFSSNELLEVSVTINSWELPSIIIVDYDGYDIYEGLEMGLRVALKTL